MRWGFRVRSTGKARVLLYDLHRVGGAIFGILIVFIALAGVLLSYPDFTARLFRLDMPTSMPMTMTHESGDTPRVDMGTAYGVAHGAFPDLRLASAETPMGPEGKYRFIFHDERGRRYAALVAADHPMLVPVVDPRRGGGAAMVESSLYPLHTGAFFADAGRWSAMGLASMVVFWALSGLYLYLSRPRKRSGKPSCSTTPAQ